ncbi:MAG TPA: isocitrate lyase/phosphoenolpyruvate mutase family protein [Candidatus Baltobacteraceae bacterium]
MKTFAELHDKTAPFILPNAWDAASARIFEDAGFPAVATSSAGAAWSLGYADGEAVDASEMIAAIARIARAVRVPVTADIEAGYASDVGGLLETIGAILDAGAVGINLEDWNSHADEPFPIETACARIEAIKTKTGDRLFVNARTDTYLRQLGDSATRFEETARRMRAFAAAGADGVFVPGVADTDTIRALAAASDLPLNVLAGPATPPLATLRELGVARVSVGSGPALRILGLTRAIARGLLDHQNFDFIREKPTLSYDEANALFSP